MNVNLYSFLLKYSLKNRHMLPLWLGRRFKVPVWPNSIQTNRRSPFTAAAGSSTKAPVFRMLLRVDAALRGLMMRHSLSYASGLLR